MMMKRYKITAEQKAELQAARKANRNKRIEKRLKALILRSEGKTNQEVSALCELHLTNVSKLIAAYCTDGLDAIIGNHYHGNRRNMSPEEEVAFLEPFKEPAAQGQIVETGAIKAAYEEKVGHSIGGSQIYRVLHRHGWRKVMPRSRHPDKVSDEAIEASKKLRTRWRAPSAR